MSIFGPHEAALQLRAARNEVLASNIANSETPGFKARDLDFKAMLGQESSLQLGLNSSNERHIQINADATVAENLKYRLPTQPSLDGNTVEADVEQAQYAENVIQYRASLMFINGKIRTLRHAISGERS